MAKGNLSLALLALGLLVLADTASARPAGMVEPAADLLPLGLVANISAMLSDRKLFKYFNATGVLHLPSTYPTELRLLIDQAQQTDGADDTLLLPVIKSKLGWDGNPNSLTTSQLKSLLGVIDARLDTLAALLNVDKKLGTILITWPASLKACVRLLRTMLRQLIAMFLYSLLGSGPCKASATMAPFSFAQFHCLLDFLFPQCAQYFADLLAIFIRIVLFYIVQAA